MLRREEIVHQFNVFVKINNGVLVLSKGSAEESSSNSHAITSTGRVK